MSSIYKPKPSKELDWQHASSISEPMSEPEGPMLDDILSGRLFVDIEQRLREAQAPTRKNATAKAIGKRACDKADAAKNSTPWHVFGSIRGSVRQMSESSAAQDRIKEVESFFRDMPDFMSMLEAVASIHPIARGVFVIFQAIYYLEKTREKNEKKVIALLLEIKDTLNILAPLNEYKKPNENTQETVSTSAFDEDTIKNANKATLKGCMLVIAWDIRKCYMACETYSKLKTTTKVIRGSGWNETFLGFSDEFRQHRKDLRDALRLEILFNTSSTLDGVESLKGTLVEVLASNRLLSEQQRQMFDFITSRYGDVESVLRNEQQISELVNYTAEDDIDASFSPSRTSGAQRFRQESAREQLRKEIKMSPKEAISSNFKVFNGKLDLSLAKIGEIKSEIRQARKDIMQEVRNQGAFSRVWDKDIRQLWQQSEWTGAVEVRHFLVGLKEMYMDRDPANQSNSADESNVPTLLEDRVLAEENAWAVGYINLQYAQAISEAIDEDASGFVTVSEMNRFTAAKPSEWSVPLWVAYWAAGWRHLQILHAREIEAIVAKMHALSATVLPENWDAVSYYLCGVEFARHALTDNLAKQPVDARDLPSKFIQFAAEEEAKMKDKLRRVRYVLDGKDSVSLFLGSGSVEKRGLLLLRLLLLQHYNILRTALHVVLDRAELRVASNSLSLVEVAFKERAQDISHGWTNQDLDLSLRFRSFAGGLLLYARDQEGFASAKYCRSHPRDPVTYASLKSSEKRYDHKGLQAALGEVLSHTPGIRRAIDSYTLGYELAVSLSHGITSGDSFTTFGIDTDFGKYQFFGYWIGQESNAPSDTCPTSLLSLCLWIVRDHGKVGALGGYSWSSRGRAAVTGSFREVDEHTELRLDFDFKRDHREFDALSACMLRSSYTIGQYDYEVTFWRVTGEDAKTLPPVVAQVVYGSRWFFAPSEKVAGSEYRAKWAWAIQQVVLQGRRENSQPPPLWSSMVSRRDNRQRILECLHRLTQISPDDDHLLEDLRSCLRELSPEDGWNYFMRMQWACLWHRRSIFSCNSCGHRIARERLFCVDCHIPDDAHMDSFDLCNRDECIENARTGTFAPGATKPHEASHRLVLFRHVLNGIYYDRILKTVWVWAKDYVNPIIDALEAAAANEENTAVTYVGQCSICRGPLSFPFWLCLTLDCEEDRACICDTCVRHARCTQPHQDLQYTYGDDGKEITQSNERTFHTVHGFDHYLLRCVPGMKRDGGAGSREETARTDAPDAAAMQKRLDAMHEEHTQLVKQHTELMSKHTELVGKHAEILDEIKRLSHGLVQPGSEAPQLDADEQSDHPAESDSEGSDT
ncbi:hypothetical protein PENSPDRAFT_754875 [Peniophora sp. CONT]|nr:hypothetical protein PENSPDRAFT_754875 [Peniophora sp. CONT]